MSIGFLGRGSAHSHRCHFIVNGTAGSTQRERVVSTLRIGLPQLKPVLHEPASVSELLKLIREIPSQEDVVLAGGDGTLQCALPALVETRRPVIILPLGTANDFAVQWGFTPDLLCVYEALRRRVVQRVDVIQCNNIYFATVGGLGVGAFLARDFNAIRRSSRVLKKIFQQIGTEVYTGFAAATIVGRRSYLREYRIETESDVRCGIFSNIFFCNQSRLGGDLQVAPDARATDGIADVLLLKGKTPVQLLLSLADLRFHRDARLSERITAQKISVQAMDGEPNLFFADGESFEMSHELEIIVHKEALCILTAGGNAG
jgi:diacylglycerol kinase family enzyme